MTFSEAILSNFFFSFSFPNKNFRNTDTGQKNNTTEKEFLKGLNKLRIAKINFLTQRSRKSGVIFFKTHI